MSGRWVTEFLKFTSLQITAIFAYQNLFKQPFPTLFTHSSDTVLLLLLPSFYISLLVLFNWIDKTWYDSQTLSKYTHVQYLYICSIHEYLAWLWVFLLKRLTSSLKTLMYVLCYTLNIHNLLLHSDIFIPNRLPLWKTEEAKIVTEWAISYACQERRREKSRYNLLHYGKCQIEKLDFPFSDFKAPWVFSVAIFCSFFARVKYRRFLGKFQMDKFYCTVAGKSIAMKVFTILLGKVKVWE